MVQFAAVLRHIGGGVLGPEVIGLGIAGQQRGTAAGVVAPQEVRRAGGCDVLRGDVVGKGLRPLGLKGRALLLVEFREVVVAQRHLHLPHAVFRLLRRAHGVAAQVKVPIIEQQALQAFGRSIGVEAAPLPFGAILPLAGDQHGHLEAVDEIGVDVVAHVGHTVQIDIHHPRDLGLHQLRRDDAHAVIVLLHSENHGLSVAGGGGMDLRRGGDPGQGRASQQPGQENDACRSQQNHRGGDPYRFSPLPGLGRNGGRGGYFRCRSSFRLRGRSAGILPGSRGGDFPAFFCLPYRSAGSAGKSPSAQGKTERQLPHVKHFPGRGVEI